MDLAQAFVAIFGIALTEIFRATMWAVVFFVMFLTLDRRTR